MSLTVASDLMLLRDMHTSVSYFRFLEALEAPFLNVELMPRSPQSDSLSVGPVGNSQ